MSSPMNSSPSHMTDEMKKLKNILGIQVHSFFKCLTEEQWELLKSCTPDESTKFQLSELLLQICNTLSKVFLTNTWRSMFSEEEIQANLGNLVTDTFKSALDINNNIQCKNADSLQKLINEEVADTVNNPQSAVPTCPKRLHMMVVHAVKMMKNFLVKKVVVCRSPKRSSTPDQEMEMMIKEEPSFNERTGNYLDFESEDTAARTEGGVHRSILESEPTLEEKKEMFVQIVIEKLFFRIFNKTKDHNLKEHKDILQRLIERTWAEVHGVDFQPSQKNLAKFDKIIFKDLCKQLGSADQVLLSLKREDDVIFNSIVSVFDRSVAPKVTMLQRICNLFTSVCQRRHRVGVMEDPAEVEKDPSDEMIKPLTIPVFEFDPTLDVRKKAFVEVVIEKLFTRISKETHCLKMRDDNDILTRLMERTWAEVEGVDFELSQKNLQDFEKIAFKDLCKQLGSANRVLMSLKMEDEAIVTSIVYAFNCRATPKRTNLFSSNSK